MTEIQYLLNSIEEVIDAEMERALNAFLKNLVERQGYHFISKCPQQNKNGAQKKLLLYDKFGIAYDIDAVIANESMQPIILIESKYIRYKKHNRDKGSWICTAHPAIRRRYESIRSSIAVLAGNWSSSSLAMMRSFDINLFLIPFELICGLLATHGIDFDWDEKDRITAVDSWRRYSALSDAQKSDIGVEMVNVIQHELGKLVLSILDDTIERELERIMIELHSNLGEVKTYEFPGIAQAIEFLNATELKRLFITSNSLTLFDSPPTLADDDN